MAWDEQRPLPSDVLVEAELFRLTAGAVPILALRAMTVTEVLDRLNAGRRVESEARRFALDASAFAWMDKTARRQVSGDVIALGRPEVRRKSALEVMPADRRIEQIGGMLSRHGDGWASAHKSDMRWLASRGVSPAEAIARHAEWYRATVAEDPFFARQRQEREERRRRFAP